MSAYREFTGKSVEEALKVAREEFGVELNDLDFEILTAGSRGVLGMGAEPARIVAAPRSALGGAAPKREAAATTPLPPAPPREDRGFGDRDRDRGPRRDDRGGGGFRSGAGPAAIEIVDRAATTAPAIAVDPARAATTDSATVARAATPRPATQRPATPHRTSRTHSRRRQLRPRNDRPAMIEARAVATGIAARVARIGVAAPPATARSVRPARAAPERRP